MLTKRPQFSQGCKCDSMPYRHFLGQLKTILPLLFLEKYHTIILHSQCIPDYLNSSAILLSRGTWLSTQNSPKTVCNLGSTQMHCRSSWCAPDPLAGFELEDPRDTHSRDTKGRKVNRQRKGDRGKELGKATRINTATSVFPLPALASATECSTFSSNLQLSRIKMPTQTLKTWLKSAH